MAGHWLQAPATVLIGAGAVALVLALVQTARCRRCIRARKPLRATWRGAWALLAFGLAVTLGGLGTTLLGYARLMGEAEVAELGVRALGPQQYAVRLTTPDGWHRSYELAGDQWQLDARVIRWELPAALAGVPPLYRLERLSGRYADIGQEREAVRTVYALDERAFPDLWTLKRQHPQWLPFVDADYGSAAYLPLIDGARYEVVLDRRGGLVARPADADTETLLDESGW